MRFDSAHLRNVFCSGAIIAATGFAGCSNTCFVGIFNGSGVVTVQSGNPPPPCSLPQPKAAINVVALKSTVCETCTADARVEHVFVTMQSVQLRPSVTDDTSKDWLEIAPELAQQPRRMDLVGNSLSEILAENANIPAEIYREIRLRFCFDSGSNQECHADAACGGELRNCLMMADGRIEPLHWPAGTPELVMALRTPEGDSLAVLPDSITDLRLSLQVQQAFSLSSLQRLTLQNVLVGRVIVLPRRSREKDNSKTD